MFHNENSVYLQLYTRAPAPCRDYCGLTITKTEVILNIWNITYGPHVYPKRQRWPLEDFRHHLSIQNLIKHLFGPHVSEYIMSIAKDEPKLQNLPTKVFHGILRHLAARDLLNLSQTSKILFERCNTEFCWKLMFEKFLGGAKRKPNANEVKMAEIFGWKKVLMKNLGKEVSKCNEKLHSRKSGRKIERGILNKNSNSSGVAAKNRIKSPTVKPLQVDKGKQKKLLNPTKSTSILAKPMTSNVNKLERVKSASKIKPTEYNNATKFIAKKEATELHKIKNNLKSTQLLEKKNNVRRIGDPVKDVPKIEVSSSLEKLILIHKNPLKLETRASTAFKVSNSAATSSGVKK